MENLKEIIEDVTACLATERRILQGLKDKRQRHPEATRILNPLIGSFETNCVNLDAMIVNLNKEFDDAGRT